MKFIHFLACAEKCSVHYSTTIQSFISDSGPYDTGVVFNILNDEFPGYPEDTKFGDTNTVLSGLLAHGRLIQFSLPSQAPAGENHHLTSVGNSEK